MVRNEPALLIRAPGGSPRASLLELFFDLVYVAALSMTSMDLAGHISWAGAIRALVPLLALWWVWSITALLTDFYDPQRLPIQVLVIVVMVGSILLAAVLPRAFRDLATVFAATYVAIHVGRGILLVAMLRGHPGQARAARFLFWFAVSAVPWLVGALVHGSLARGAWWGLALAIDYVMGGLRYPTPWLGRVPLNQYDRAQEHVGERYQQFMILALGDLILVAVQSYSRGLGAAHTAAFLLTFATTVLLWQIYVYRAGSLLRNLPAGRPGRVLRWAPYTHPIMIFGIVVAAAGAEVVIRRPTGASSPDLIGAVFGGPALFLVGRTTFEYQVFARISWSRLAWMVVLVGVAPAMVLVAPVVAAAVQALVLAGVATSDAIRGRSSRLDPKRPPGRGHHPGGAGTTPSTLA